MTLRRYQQFLNRMLSFPFEAVYHEPVSPLEDISHAVVVVAVVDPDNYPEAEGLNCRVILGGGAVEVPLVDLEVDPHSQNFEFIEDYWYWAWNGQRRDFSRDR